MGNTLRSTGVRNCSAMECCMTLSIPCAIRLHSASRPHVGHSPSTGVYIRDRNSSGWTGTHDSFRAGRSEKLTNPMIPLFTPLTFKHNKKNHKLQISVNWSLLGKKTEFYTEMSSYGFDPQAPCPRGSVSRSLHCPSYKVNKGTKVHITTEFCPQNPLK